MDICRNGVPIVEERFVDLHFVPSLCTLGDATVALSENLSGDDGLLELFHFVSGGPDVPQVDVPLDGLLLEVDVNSPSECEGHDQWWAR